MASYNPHKIEKKWQERWKKEGTFVFDEKSKKQKFYNLVMFPYPSGEGLHMGHAFNYTGSDIQARYHALRGYNVLNPMGWDAFGLPAENYAVRTGIHPSKTTKDSIVAFKLQMDSIGFVYDWTREVSTADPEFHRWTQWLFVRLFKKGLAYQAEAPVNWDPVDQTVLANEQVLPDGTAERSGAKVEQRMLKQWFFKITDYAEELLDGLDGLNWPERIKVMQRNWIGRSAGALLQFKVQSSKFKVQS